MFDPKQIKVCIAISLLIVAFIAGVCIFSDMREAPAISGQPAAVFVSDKINENTSPPVAPYPSTSVDADIENKTHEPTSAESVNAKYSANNRTGESREIVNNNLPKASVEPNGRMQLKERFKDSVINNHTLQVAAMIQSEFSDSLDVNSDNLWAHYNQVEEFLQAQLDDQAKVDEFLDFYKKYIAYEMAQVNDPYSFQVKTPENPEEAIRLNNEKLRYQRDVFGREVADTLWGDEARMHEYKMKELEILRAESYSPQVKEQLIKDLREQTFADGNGQQDTDYNYQLYLKLAIHSDDLSRMTEGERNEKIREFRNEIFPPDELKFLDFLEGVVITDPDETNHAGQEDPAIQ